VSGPLSPLRVRNGAGEAVSHLSDVDQVHAEVVPDKPDGCSEFRFMHVFKADDRRGTDKGMRREREFGEVGVEVDYFPCTTSASSTMLRSALAALHGGGVRVNA
jgi:glycerol-3-phosphate cytidylyltransferase